MEDVEMRERPHENDPPPDEGGEQETSFTEHHIYNDEGLDLEHQDYDENEDNEKVIDRLPYNHPLRKTWGEIKKNVKPANIVLKNEKIRLLREEFDIHVYDDYYSRLMLENIKIGYNRRGEESYVEYRNRKIYVKREVLMKNVEVNGEFEDQLEYKWQHSRNPINQKYVLEFEQLAREIRKERLASAAGEIERLMSLDKTNPEELNIEWFDQRDFENLEVENVKSRIQTVLDFMETEATEHASTDFLRRIDLLKKDLQLLDEGKKPESEDGIRLMEEEISSLKNVNRINEWCKKNLGPLGGIASVVVGAGLCLF